MDFFDCFKKIVTENIQDTTDSIFVRKAKFHNSLIENIAKIREPLWVNGKYHIMYLFVVCYHDNTGV